MASAKYQKLQNTDDEETHEDPPSYEASVEIPSTSHPETCAMSDPNVAVNVCVDGMENIPIPEPPPYKAVEKLPSYQEMQDWKVYEAQREILNIYFPPDPETNSPNIEGVTIGDDCTFIFAFVVAFFFNWIGLCIGLCIMQMMSTRYGAMAGFGASIIKWILIMKYSACCEEYTMDQQIFAWWIPLFIGTLFVVKGLLGWFQTRKLLKLTDEERLALRFKYFGIF